MGIKSLPAFLKKEDIHHHLNKEKSDVDDVNVVDEFFDGFNVEMDDGDEYEEMKFWGEFLMPKCEEKEPQYTFCEEEEDDDDDEKKMKSLNLSLNYQGVLDAWSDRTLWADDSSFPTTSTIDAYVMEMGGMAGAVATAGEERKQRVLRYKEKRQTRLFSKKIRYQVRKLNAENRPRLKGRFVKRVAEKMHK